MPRRKTHTEYEQDLLSKNIVYIPIESYAGSKNKILHKCPEGHEWSARPNDILSGVGCPSCRRTKQSISQLKTHEQYELELSLKNISYKPLEKSYTGARNKILHKCSSDHEWYTTPNKILSGRGCPECNIINRTKKHEEYLEELQLKTILHKPLEKYCGSNTSILHECPEGHKWNAIPRGILRGSGCPTCSKAKRTKSHEEYLEELRSKGVTHTPIEIYINNNSKLLHQCSCPKKFIWQASPSDVLRGSGCPNCVSYGFKPGKPAKLYFFSFEHGNTTYYKVGITNRTTKERHRDDWNRLKIMVLWEIDFEKGVDARIMERQILSENKDYLVNTKALLSGNTETFSVFVPKPKC